MSDLHFLSSWIVDKRCFIVTLFIIGRFTSKIAMVSRQTDGQIPYLSTPHIITTELSIRE